MRKITFKVMKPLCLLGIGALMMVTACGKQVIDNQEPVEIPQASVYEEVKEEKKEPAPEVKPEKKDTASVEKTEEKEPENAVKTEKTTRAGKTTKSAWDSYGKLHVEGTTLADEDGNAVQLKGVSSAGLQWFGEFANRNALETMQNEWGIDVFRLALYTAEGGYCECDANKRNELKKIVTDTVEDCHELGLYVIIDWHILHDTDPNIHKDEAIKFFDEMASLYKDYDNVIYEICNEPNGGTDWSVIKSYAEEVIPVIKAYNEDAIIVVGTPTWSQEVDKAAADPLKGYSNIMYTLHYYADTHKQSLRDTMKGALDKGLPIFVTEYGICDASGNGAINAGEAAAWMKFLDENNISSCIWNLANKNETSCLIKAACSKHGGWTADDLSGSGKWFVEMMKGNLEGLGTGDYTEEPGSGGSGSTNPTVYSGNGGKLSAAATTCNPWSSGNEGGEQIDIYVTNDGDKTVSGWTVVVTLDEEISVDNGWNCNYSGSGKTITISPVNEDWVKNIGPGETVSGVGVYIRINASSANIVSVEVK